MRHGLGGLSTYGVKGHGKGDEHPAYAPEGHGMLYLLPLVSLQLFENENELQCMQCINIRFVFVYTCKTNLFHWVVFSDFHSRLCCLQAKMP